jgi:hypothetical protein
MDDHQASRPIPSQAAGATRQRRVEGGRRHAIKLRLDDAEYEAVTSSAAELKLSVQRFLLSSALARRFPPAPARIPSQLAAELAGLRRLTANLANNINQIARALNSGATPTSSITAAADAVRRAMLRLDSVLAVLSADSSARPTARSAGPTAAPVSRGSARIAAEAPR